jgi:undecaprenyl-diphosphatase
VDDYLRAVILGLVQALTEFLPISSSGHLVLVGHLLGERANALTFDVGLHVGTLVAVLAYFWREWLDMAGHGIRDVAQHRAHIGRWDWRSRLLAWIALGTLPAVAVGLLFNNAIEDHLRQAWLVGVLLIAFALVIEAADRLPGKRGRLNQVGPRDALLVGVAQAVALVPGVSRSGATIAAARSLGFDRAIAARFSFLLSAPAVLGAATLKLSEAIAGNEHVDWGPMIVGAIVSGLAGAAVIHWLLRFLQVHGMRAFVWYRIGLGAIVLVIAGLSVL